MADFDRTLHKAACFPLTACDIQTIQVNVGLVCNQRCTHCHLACSPDRAESMAWRTMEAIASLVGPSGARTVDVTGGEPSLHPDLRAFVELLRRQDVRVQVRTNLTGLLEPDNESLPEFFRDNEVQLVGSMPCYLQENVDAQRGPGTYPRSIDAMRRLNAVGYGRDPELQLDLVYNPAGPSLPPSQLDLEADYRRQLDARFGIAFTNLITITNMPIGRFQAELARQGLDEEYVELLAGSFNPQTIDTLMCRHQISVNWDGSLYDCDFNLALGCPVNHGAPDHLRDFDPSRLIGREIVTGRHCFACTAGSGSSCGGALV